jgi:hypothetical protein
MAPELSRRAFSLSACAVLPLLSQDQAAPPYVPKQSDRPEALAGDEDGFQSIFDGRTLNGWEGDPSYWRVANGVMTGEITPETVIKSNTFIVWRGGAPADFELKVDYRITERGNNYEEKGRLFLAQRGEVTHVTGVRKPVILARTGENAALAAAIREDWNSVHLTRRLFGTMVRRIAALPLTG